MSTIKPEAKESPKTDRPVVLQPDEGRAVEAFGDTIHFKLDGEQTGSILGYRTIRSHSCGPRRPVEAPH